MTLPDNYREYARQRAAAELALEYQKFRLEELRWDYGCNIHEDTRAIIRAELDRRGIAFEDFEKLGRGRRRGGSFFRKGPAA